MHPAAVAALRTNSCKLHCPTPASPSLSRCPPSSCAAVLQQAAALPHNFAAWPLLALMALTVYAAFPPALAGAIEEDFGFMSVGEHEEYDSSRRVLGVGLLDAEGVCKFGHSMGERCCRRCLCCYAGGWQTIQLLAHAAAWAGSDRPLLSSSLPPTCSCLQPRRRRMGGQPCWAWRCWWRWSGTAATASSELPPQSNASLRSSSSSSSSSHSGRRNSYHSSCTSAPAAVARLFVCWR